MLPEAPPEAAATDSPATVGRGAVATRGVAALGSGAAAMVIGALLLALAVPHHDGMAGSARAACVLAGLFLLFRGLVFILRVLRGKDRPLGTWLAIAWLAFLAIGALLLARPAAP